MKASRLIRTALVCPTIGQTRRGYERFFSELFDRLKNHVDVTLFKGAGDENEHEKTITHLSRTGTLSRVLPGRYLYKKYLLEFGSYGVGLIPHLAFGNFDLVHFIDPPLARMLHSGRRLFRSRYRLVFTDARPWSFDCSRWADHIQFINPASVEAARRSGLDENRMTMLPIGSHPASLRCEASQLELRRKYGVPDGQKIVLSVTSFNRAHKRVDYLIEEAAAAGGDLLLWLDGSLHPDGDPSLLSLGTEKLGDRFRRTHVPSDRVGELLRMADVFVSSAIEEPFGMAIVEAMACGLPVVTHDSAHFRWLTDGLADFVDMSAPGNLASYLRQWQEATQTTVDPQALGNAARRFDWDNLTSGYLGMYERALEPTQNGKRAARQLSWTDL